MLVHNVSRYIGFIPVLKSVCYGKLSIAQYIASQYNTSTSNILNQELYFIDKY